MLAILWHSRTGTAAALARAAQEGAGDCARLIAAAEATPDDLLEADGYLFVCPENLASMSGAMKEMFDTCYYPLLGKIEGRPFATIIAAGSDGEGAQTQIDRIARGWRLKRAAPHMIVNMNAQTPEQILAPKRVPGPRLAEAHDLGQAFGKGLEMGIF